MARDPIKNPAITKTQFITSAEMPYLIYQACLQTATVSATVYIQHAVCEALARDLQMPLDRLLSALPPPRSTANRLSDPAHHPNARPGNTNTHAFWNVVRVGPANTDENVR